MGLNTLQKFKPQPDGIVCWPTVLSLLNFQAVREPQQLIF